MIKVPGVVLRGLIIIGVIACNAMKEDEQRAVAQASADPSTAVSVSADQLQADYAANEVRADKLYRGKVLRVSGAVQAIKKDITDDPYVQIWTRNEFMPVHAMFDEEGTLASMQPGQRVTMLCVGDNVILGSPIVRHCVLSVSSSNPPESGDIAAPNATAPPARQMRTAGSPGAPKPIGASPTSAVRNSQPSPAPPRPAPTPIDPYSQPPPPPSSVATPAPTGPARVPVVGMGVVPKLSGDLPAIQGDGEGGDVLAKLCIDASGAVTSSKIVKAPAGVGDNLGHAFDGWRYQPYTNPTTSSVSPVCFPVSVHVTVVHP